MKNKKQQYIEKMDTFYFYVYLLVIITITILFTIGRCYFDIHFFDVLFYPNENDKILDNKVFLAFHILTNFAFGLLFGYDVMYGMMVKIIFFEIYLYFTHYCDIFKTAKFSNLVIVVIISLASYLAGCVFYKTFNDVVSKM
jgi:hypothetical protein